MRRPRFTIRTLMIVVAVASFAAWGWVSFVGMDAGSGGVLVLMVLLPTLHLVGFLVASLIIAGSTFAAGRIGSLLGKLVAPPQAAAPDPPGLEDRP